MEVVICQDEEQVGAVAADRVIAQLQGRQTPVLGLATGSSPLNLYAELKRRAAAGDVNFAHALGFALDEYVGLDPKHPLSYRATILRTVVEPLGMQPERVRVPDGFVTAGVVRCSQDLSWTSVPAPAGPSPTSEPNTRYTIVEEHLSGDFEPLLTALAQPSDHQDRGECPAMAEIVPDLWLLNTAGKAVHVQWPLTACNFTKPGVMEALADLTVTSSTILHFPVPRTSSEDSTAAGPATVAPASGAAK